MGCWQFGDEFYLRHQLAIYHFLKSKRTFYYSFLWCINFQTLKEYFNQVIPKHKRICSKCSLGAVDDKIQFIVPGQQKLYVVLHQYYLRWLLRYWAIKTHWFGRLKNLPKKRCSSYSLFSNFDYSYILNLILSICSGWTLLHIIVQHTFPYGTVPWCYLYAYFIALHMGRILPKHAYFHRTHDRFHVLNYNKHKITYTCTCTSVCYCWC